MLTIYCSKIFFIVCLYCSDYSYTLVYANHKLRLGNLLPWAKIFSADSHTLLCAYPEVQQGNPLSYANISLPQAARCYMLMYCSEVTQSNLNSSNTDGSFTMANSNSILSPLEIFPIVQENKYLKIFSYFIMKLHVV